MNLLSTSIELPRRLRRNRKSSAIRELIQENTLRSSQFVAPLFVVEGNSERQIIPSLPGVHRLSLDFLMKEVEELYNVGIRAVDLFAYIPEEKKDRYGSEALNRNNLLAKAIASIKKAVPDMCVMADIALDPYTDHGHDGIMNDDGIIENDSTIDLLAEMSLLAADAGVDIIAPSDMMDGRVKYIRSKLDEAGHENVGILAYSAKFASSFYGPFRQALGSAPKIGDKKSYQLNPANSREALLECLLDESEGADMLLVKPALAYIDIVAKLREQTLLPIGAYHVSGEYAMVMAAFEKGWLDADAVFYESFMGIRRAGADFIFTYAAKRMAERL